MAQSSTRTERVAQNRPQGESGKCHRFPSGPANRRGWLRKLTAAAIVPGIAVGLVAVLQGPAQAQAIPGKPMSIQQGEHIDVGRPHSPYNSNPPTSGPHYARAANWGVYRKEGLDEQFVHSLEHGGIWISYKDVDEETISKLEKIAELNPGSVVLSPRSRNDAPIVVASWGRLLQLEEFDKRQISLFITINKNRSPEKLAR